MKHDLDEFKGRLLGKIKALGVQFVSEIGKWKNSNGLFRDFDFLVLLNKKPPRDDPTNSKKYAQLLGVINKMQDEFAKKGLVIHVFPTFKLEGTTRYLAFKKKKENLLFLHLLVYPSLQNLLKWESPSMISSFIENAVNPLNKDLNKIKTALMERVRSTPFNERTQSLLSTLYEAYTYFRAGQLTDDFSRMEAIHKVGYVVRFLTAEALLEYNLELEDILSWEKMLQKLALLEVSEKKLVKDIYSYQISKLVPTRQELELLFDRTFLYFNQLLQFMSKR